MKTTSKRVPWNKGRLVVLKAPLKAKNIWVLRLDSQHRNDRLQLELFNLAS